MTNPQLLTLPAQRAERLNCIQQMFPNAQGAPLAPHWPGGRQAALKRLSKLDAALYSRSRNYLNGAVSKLSPYFRHGCLTLKEAADHALNQHGEQAHKFVQELAWRDYWRRVWYSLGNAIFSDIEPPKVELGRQALPNLLRQGQTGLPCMDAFIHDLNVDGHVHNHARMWLAAYVVHWLKIDWRAAADWLENQLLDGDKASNHLSWQWAASTFGSKPYYFNQENLSRFTGNQYCKTCRAKCPFDASYETLNDKLFTENNLQTTQTYAVAMPPKTAAFSQTAGLTLTPAQAILVHDEMLTNTHPLLQSNLPKVFVFDNFLHGQWPLKRLQFMADCLSEMPNVAVWAGDTPTVLRQLGISQITTQNTPNLQLKALLQPFKPVWQPEPALVGGEINANQLKRFSRYWDKVAVELLGENAFKRPK